MQSVLTTLSTTPPQTLLRLLTIPVFAWIGWKDYQTRRVSNAYWPPLLGIGVACIAADALTITNPTYWNALTTALVLTVTVVAPALMFAWYSGNLGGADVKGIVTLAVVIPVTPGYYTTNITTAIPDTPIFIFAVLLNLAVLLIGTLAVMFLYAAYTHGRRTNSTEPVRTVFFQHTSNTPLLTFVAVSLTVTLLTGSLVHTP